MARMITAPGIIRHIDKYTNTMRKLQFSIAVSDWTESSGVYTAEWLNDYITASSFEIATYDHTLRDNGKGDIELEKKSGGGGLVFTTNALPTGTITGIVYVFDTQDGKLPVLLEDGTVEIEQGGTGATTAAGALANFGLDNAANAQAALGFGDAVQMGVANGLSTTQEGYVLDARQGKALNDTLNSKINTTTKGYTPTQNFTGSIGIIRSGYTRQLVSSLAASNDLTAGTSYAIATLETADIPYKYYGSNWIDAIDNASGDVVKFSIDSNGVISLIPTKAYSSGKNFTLFATYISKT